MTKKDDLVFFVGVVAFVFCNLHVLRNLSPIFPAVTGVFLGLAIFLILLIGLPIARNSTVLLGVFLTCMMFAVLNSYANFPDESYVEATVRFFLTIPFLFIGAFLCDRKVRVFLLISALFGAIGGASLLFQSFFGQIEWFADSSERGGLVRYSSILGSLTIFGSFSGIALSAIYFIDCNKFVKAAILVLIVIGCFLSLQKAAVANFILFVIFISYVELKAGRYLRLALFGLALFISLVALTFFIIDYVDFTLNNFFRFDESAVIDDYDPVEGFIQRIWELPSSLFEAYGWHGVLIGIGLVGGAGALGFPDYPMAHNFVFDMLFIGGPLYLISYTLLVIFALLRARSFSSDCTDVSMASFFCIVFFIINLPASTGIQYQPVISSIINVLIGYYYISTRTRIRSNNV